LRPQVVSRYVPWVTFHPKDTPPVNTDRSPAVNNTVMCIFPTLLLCGMIAQTKPASDPPVYCPIPNAAPYVIKGLVPPGLTGLIEQTTAIKDSPRVVQETSSIGGKPPHLWGQLHAKLPPRDEGLKYRVPPSLMSVGYTYPVIYGKVAVFGRPIYSQDLRKSSSSTVCSVSWIPSALRNGYVTVLSSGVQRDLYEFQNRVFGPNTVQDPSQFLRSQAGRLWRDSKDGRQDTPTNQSFLPQNDLVPTVRSPYTLPQGQTYIVPRAIALFDERLASAPTWVQSQTPCFSLRSNIVLTSITRQVDTLFRPITLSTIQPPVQRRSVWISVDTGSTDRSPIPVASSVRSLSPTGSTYLSQRVLPRPPSDGSTTRSSVLSTQFNYRVLSSYLYGANGKRFDNTYTAPIVDVYWMSDKVETGWGFDIPESGSGLQSWDMELVDTWTFGDPTQ